MTFLLDCHYCGLVASKLIWMNQNSGKATSLRYVCDYCLRFNEGAKRVAKDKRIEEIDYE